MKAEKVKKYRSDSLLDQYIFINGEKNQTHLHTDNNNNKEYFFFDISH